MIQFFYTKRAPLRSLVITLIICFGKFASTNAQQTLSASLVHDGITRSYILYVPELYTDDTPAPLVFNFHGYTSNANDQMNYGDFRPLADTNGFIIVHPMGTVDNNGNTHFNVGWGTSTVDDVGFTEALIDEISSNYTIDASRIYSTGMSNGGFMSYKLACELSNRFAAIASVTGTMNKNQTNSCNPTHQMPVMEIHGTSDPTVPYEGANWIESTPSVLSFWANFNNCHPDPEITDIEDSNTSDGSTVEYQLYTNGDNGATVAHYKIINGGHKWPGTSYNSPGTNYDIDASALIWNFFSKYDINGLISTLSVTDFEENNTVTKIYPNPVHATLTVTLKNTAPVSYTISSLDGKLLSQGSVSIQDNKINCSTLTADAVYVLTIGNTTVKIKKT
ncbi:prolyl oligopeptidase family serine peptidase [Aquimarina brevivitae]|uniref:Polyhydroxybutyrate depolymerase n=1 Tax=Aquimarina brevivitae TaxID=323412 RepID=A0A4Q7P1K1_9FLAO|nr:PHB depolymerase family esterase [Aquimarina brevivitae]RZS93594.1 polyhydroxybutyrate depolymerase [Aquimarina brevivitae]